MSDTIEPDFSFEALIDAMNCFTAGMTAADALVVVDDHLENNLPGSNYEDSIHGIGATALSFDLDNLL